MFTAIRKLENGNWLLVEWFDSEEEAQDYIKGQSEGEWDVLCW